MLRRLLLAIPASLFALLMAATLPVLAGGGCHGAGRSTTDAGGTAVDMKLCAFTPTILRIQPGDTVTWTNQDPFDHLVTGVGWGDGTRLLQGQSFKHAFTLPGIYPYTCSLHSGMSGAVVVGDTAAARVVAAPVAAKQPAGPAGGNQGVALALGLSLLAGLAGFAIGRRFMPTR